MQCETVTLPAARLYGLPTIIVLDLFSHCERFTFESPVYLHRVGDAVVFGGTGLAKMTPMTTDRFQPNITNQIVDWSNPAVWVGGVVPDGPGAKVVIPVVTLSSGQTNISFISIASDESYSADSVSLASNYLTIKGDLTVATDFAIQAGGEVDMGGGTLNAATLENDGSDIQGYGLVTTTGVLTNHSEIVGNGLTLTLGGLINNGTLEAASGNLTVQVPSGFAQFSDGALTGGSYEAGTNSSTLYLDIGGVVTTDGATITLDGGGAIDSYDSATLTYVSIQSTMGLIAAGGTLSLADQTYDWQTPLTVAGTLSISSTYITQTVLDVPQLTIDPGGIVSGAGTINGPIANSGVISAGSVFDPLSRIGGGTLDIQGAVTGDGTIEIRPRQFAGTSFTHPLYAASELELGGPDSNNVSFGDGIGFLQLDDPSAFSGVITHGAPGDQIILLGVSNASVTGYSYAGNGAGGTLTIEAGGTAYALNFAGDYGTSSFTLSPGPQPLQSSPPSLLITSVAPDILWQNTDGQAAIWEMNGVSPTGGGLVGVNPGPTWRAVGTGDFNDDARSDILWQNTSGQAEIWEMGGTSLIGGGPAGANPGPTWRAVGTGDFNDDHHSDILWQNTSGQAEIWEMDGPLLFGGGPVGINPGPTWRAVGTGDFNDDGHSDILWQNTSGQVEIWEMNGTDVIGGGPVSIDPGPTWQAIGTGDLNEDGHSDILWQNTSGQVAIWDMNGTDVIGGGVVNIDPGPIWHAIGTGGGSDILFQSTNGQAAIWDMNGTNVVGGGTLSSNSGPTWRAVGMT